MSKRLREGLGLLAIGLACVVVSLAGLGTDDGSMAEQLFSVLRITGGLFAIGGLVVAAVELLRPTP